MKNIANCLLKILDGWLKQEYIAIASEKKQRLLSNGW